MRAGLLVASAMLICSCSAGTPDAGSRSAGVVQGGMVREDVEDREDVIKQQEEILRRQEAQIERQERELEDLKRQQLHNQSLKRYEK